MHQWFKLIPYIPIVSYGYCCKNVIAKELDDDGNPVYENTFGVSKIKDSNGQCYTIYVCNYAFLGDLYRYAAIKDSEKISYNDEND